MNKLWYVTLTLCIVGIICLIASCSLRVMEPSKPIDVSPDTQADRDYIVSLPPGEKLVTINWERTNNHGHVYALTRPMRQGEVPEVYTYRTIDGRWSNIYEIHENGVNTNEEPVGEH